MKNIFSLALGALCLIACNTEINDSVIENGTVNKVVVTVAPMVEKPGTRTVLSKDANNNTIFVWSDNDEIGIFPDQGYQTGFSMASAAGSASAEFTGGGWGLKPSSIYAAYYPLIHDFDLDKTAIPLDYSGQVQNGNGNSAHLSAYDFMTAPDSTPSNGTVNFNFGHLGTLLHFKFTVPESAELTSIILKTNGSFIEKAKLNLTTNKVTATATRENQTLLLENVSVAANGVLDAYMMVAAVNLSDKTLEATVTSSAGVAYVASLTAQNFVGGDVWNYTRTLAKETGGNTYLGHEYVDLGITDENGNKVLWATTNVGAENPWENGGYYAWGETKAFGEEDTSNEHNYDFTGNTSYTKILYDWCTYKWATGPDWNSISKYSFADGQKQNLWYNDDAEYVGLELDGYKQHKILDTNDDAATANWGGKWRIPTTSELMQLCSKCCWIYVSNYKNSSIDGCIVYKAKVIADQGYKGTQPRGQYTDDDPHLFFSREGGVKKNTGLSLPEGYYWASELCTNGEYYSNHYTYYGSHLTVGNGIGASGGLQRCFGLNIRPVFSMK